MTLYSIYDQSIILVLPRNRLAAMAPRTEAGSFMVDLGGVPDYRMKESGR